MSDTRNATASFPLLGILGLIFITLKLTSVITWSWWWVLAPFWLPLTVVLGILGVVGTIYLVLNYSAIRREQ